MQGILTLMSRQADSHRVKQRDKKSNILTVCLLCCHTCSELLLVCWVCLLHLLWDQSSATSTHADIDTLTHTKHSIGIYVQEFPMSCWHSNTPPLSLIHTDTMRCSEACSFLLHRACRGADYHWQSSCLIIYCTLFKKDPLSSQPQSHTVHLSVCFLQGREY